MLEDVKNNRCCIDRKRISSSGSARRLLSRRGFGILQDIEDARKKLPKNFDLGSMLGQVATFVHLKRLHVI